MSFQPNSDLKFYAATVLSTLLFGLIFYSCQNLIRDPFQKCTHYCEGKNDKLTAVDTASGVIDCLCFNDVQKHWKGRALKTIRP